MLLVHFFLTVFFRKQLKVLFDNLAGVNKDLVIEYVRKFTTNTLSEWRTASFQDVEIAIYLLYLMGEAIPASGGNHFTGDEVFEVNCLIFKERHNKCLFL